jgi:hypothetical protein
MATAPKKRKNRLLRVLFWTATVVSVLIVAAPHAVALDSFRAEVEQAMSDALGTECRVERIGFSWFSGFGVQGVQIANPPGFAADRPCLRIERFGGTIHVVDAFLGRANVGGSIEGLQLVIDEDEYGTSNLERLFGRGTTIKTSRGGDRPKDAPRDGQPKLDGLERLQLDLQLADARIEVRRRGETLETIEELDVRLHKSFDARRLALDVVGHLAAAAGAVTRGKLAMEVRYDIDSGTLHGTSDTEGLELGRYAPLLRALAPDLLTEIEGRVDGRIDLTYTADGALAVDGSLTVAAPVLAGPALQGMRLHADRWTLRPTLSVPNLDTPTTFDASRFAADFGFARIVGLTQQDAEERLGRDDVLAFRCECDVAAMAEFGGPLPDWLKGSGSRATVFVGIPPDALADPASLRDRLVAVLEGHADKVDLHGCEVRELTFAGSLRDGKAEFSTAESSLLNGGPLRLQVATDRLTTAGLPATVTLQWRGGELGGAITQALVYAVPLFVGIDPKAADLRGSCDLQLQLRGPTARAGGENWLQLANRWAGEGSVSLSAASLKPPAALQGILQPLGATLGPQFALGDGGRLSIESFANEFTIREGFVESKLGSWLARGKKIGLSGRIALDGTVDYGLDVSALLAEHRDGARVLAALGGKAPAAGLRGSVTAPQLQLPDFGAAFAAAAKNELEKQGKDLLQRGLDELFKKTKKKR